MSDYKMRVSVKGLFFNDKNQVLLVKCGAEDAPSKFWSAPGGGIEDSEEAIHAVERELTEETGYFGTVDRLIFVQDLKFSWGVRQIEVFFRGKIDETKPPLAKSDHEHIFVSEEAFKKIKFMPADLNPFVLTESIPFHSAIK
jgi:ADP-ribose pyrophosphatase YjhB (NUDIX family)